MIVGKTTTHEFAYGPTGDVSATGPVRNSRDPSRMAGGSSAGSAAAVAAGIVPLAVGTGHGRLGCASRRHCAGLRGSARPSAACRRRACSRCRGRWTPSARSPRAWRTWSRGSRRWAASGFARRSRRRAPCGSAWWRVRGSIGSPTPSPWGSAVWSSGSRAPGRESARPSWAGRRGARHGLTGLVQSAEAVAVHAERLERAPERYEPETLARLRTAAEVPAWRYAAALRRLGELRAGAAARLDGLDALLLGQRPGARAAGRRARCRARRRMALAARCAIELLLALERARAAVTLATRPGARAAAGWRPARRLPGWRRRAAGRGGDGRGADAAGISRAGGPARAGGGSRLVGRPPPALDARRRAQPPLGRRPAHAAHGSPGSPRRAAPRRRRIRDAQPSPARRRSRLAGPDVISTRSPARTSRLGLTAWPLTWTRPPLTASAASGRVLTRRAAHSHLSTRTGVLRMVHRGHRRRRPCEHRGSPVDAPLELDTPHGVARAHIQAAEDATAALLARPRRRRLGDRAGPRSAPSPRRRPSSG